MDAISQPTGDEDIDEMRVAARNDPTTPENYRERMVLVRGWRLYLQRRGADVSDCLEVEAAVLQAIREEDTSALCAAIDEEIEVLEELEALAHTDPT